MYNRFKSVLLVALQFLLILLLLLNTSIKSVPALAYVFIILSVILVFWAIAAMQKSKLSILPEPSANAVLITNGPYRFVRHPMYTAIIIGSIGLLISHFSAFSLGCMLALLIILLIKLTWEEKMLSKKFTAYENYMKHTSRLIPYIF